MKGGRDRQKVHEKKGDNMAAGAKIEVRRPYLFAHGRPSARSFVRGNNILREKMTGLVKD